MDSLLYKVSVTDTLLGTKTDILRGNEKYMWKQVTSLASILFIVYANEFLSMKSDFNIGLCVTATYVCTTIKIVTVMQLVNFVLYWNRNLRYWTDILVLMKILPNTDLTIICGRKCYRHHVSVMRTIGKMMHCKQRQDSTNITIQNSWLHKEKLHLRALRVIWDVLCDISSSVNSIYGLQILLCIVLAFIEITTNLS